VIFVIDCQFSQIQDPATIRNYIEENVKAERLHAVVLDGGLAFFYFDY
jgi:hypothetical protein